MKRFALLFTTFAISVMGLMFSVPAPQAFAAKCEGESANIFIPSWYAGLCGEDKKSIDPFYQRTGETGAQLGSFLVQLATNIVTIILYVVGYVSLAFIIVGGFKYMTQGDSSSGTVAARKTIQNAVIGLILSIASVAIVKFVAESIR